jgi:hypothetical protein
MSPMHLESLMFLHSNRRRYNALTLQRAVNKLKESKKNREIIAFNEDQEFEGGEEEEEEI